MFTNIEGEWDEVMAVIKECVDTMAQAAPRISVVVKLDHRPGNERPYESKGGVCRALAVRELRSCWVTGDAWDRESARTKVPLTAGSVGHFGTPWAPSGSWGGPS